MITRRARLNLTQEDLAARAGVSLRSITLWEGGTGEPTLRMVHRIAEALGVTAGWLLGEDPRATGVAEETARDRFHARTDRILSRLSELTDSEYGRMEPVFLGMVEAVLGCRNDAALTAAAKDRIGALAKAVVDDDIERVSGNHGQGAPATPGVATPGNGPGVDVRGGSSGKSGRASY